VGRPPPRFIGRKLETLEMWDIDLKEWKRHTHHLRSEPTRLPFAGQLVIAELQSVADE
jgi:hypothetical protein